MTEIGGVNFNSLVSGNTVVQNAVTERAHSKFNELVKSIQANSNEKTSVSGDARPMHTPPFNTAGSTLASEQIVDGTRLNGDWKSGFGGAFNGENDKTAKAQGAAANQSGAATGSRTIDRTSKLYEQALEMESYFVKIMLSSMRNTIQKSGLNGNDYASQIYDDMMYDEYATTLTKNAGFGLADEIYLQLNRVDVEA